MQSVTRSVTIESRAPLMLDPYAGDNKTALPPEQKFYFGANGKLIIPAINLHSMLCALNTRSAVKMFYDPRQYKGVAAAVLGFVVLRPHEIPLMRDGKQIEFQGFGKNGITLRKDVARLQGGIPNPKQRPVIAEPWGLSFELEIFENDVISEPALRNLFVQAGAAIGIGTYRGVFGKFAVTTWE